MARPLDPAVTRRAAILAAACLGVAGGCRREAVPREATPASAPVVRELMTPAGPGSLAPNLFTTGDRRVLLSWVEPVGEGRHALRFAARAKGGPWSEPLTIAEGTGWFVN